MTSDQKVLIYTTHNKNAIAKLYSFALGSKMTDKQLYVRNFAKFRNFDGQH